MLKSEMCRSNPLAKTFINGSFEDRSSFLIYCFLQKCMKHYVETIYLGGMKLNFNWFQIIIDFLFLVPPHPSVFCMHYLSVFTLIKENWAHYLLKV